MTRITLVRVGWGDYRPWALGKKAGSLAWCDLDSGVVYVRRGADRFLCALARLAHEIWHIRNQVGNSAHHPWMHRCIASYFPFRRFRAPCNVHLEDGYAWYARTLQQEGSVSFGDMA